MPDNFGDFLKQNLGSAPNVLGGTNVDFAGIGNAITSTIRQANPLNKIITQPNEYRNYSNPFDPVTDMLGKFGKNIQSTNPFRSISGKSDSPTTQPKQGPQTTPPSSTATRSNNLDIAQQMSTMGNSNRKSENDNILELEDGLSKRYRSNKAYESNADIVNTKRLLTEVSPMVSGILSDRQQTSLANEFPYKMYDTQSQLMNNAFATQSQANASKLGALVQASKGRYQ